MKRAVIGQYMTPTPIGRFMAILFNDLAGKLHILDPGAGVGSLTAALVNEYAMLPSSLILLN